MGEHIDTQLTDYADGKRADVRMEIARIKYTTHNNDATVLYRTTRAGTTTALIAESLNRNEQFVCIQPNTRIANETVSIEAKQFSNRPDARILHIPANSKCLLNVEKCEKYPDLKKLKMLPISFECGPDKCHKYEECPLTAPLREQWDGITLTYSKLSAIMLAPFHVESLVAGLQLQLMSATNFILDEVHCIEHGTMKPQVIHRSDDPMLYHFDIKPYMPLATAYPHIFKAIEAYDLFRKHPYVRTATKELVKEAMEKDSFTKTLTRRITNDSPMPDTPESAVRFFNGLVSLMIERHKYKLSVPQVVFLHDLFFFATSTEISLSARSIPHKQCAVVRAYAVNNIMSRMIFSFFDKMQREHMYKHREQKRVFVTSATLGDIDFSQFFNKYMPIHHEMFGAEGDPMGTNRQLKIICDGRAYTTIGKNATHRYFGADERTNATNAGKRLNVANFIIDVIKQHGEDIYIVTVSKADARRLEHVINRYVSSRPGLKEFITKPVHVTYYRSDDTMGIKSNSRVMVSIGIGYQPSNSFDVYASSLPESRKMLAESIQAATYQAWGRPKSPSGEDTAIIYALFTSKLEATACCKWGINRKVGGEGGNVQKWGIDFMPRCEREISMPEIIECGRHEMLEIGRHYVIDASRPKTERAAVNPNTDYVKSLCGVAAFEQQVTEPSEPINKEPVPYPQNYPVGDLELSGQPIDADFPDPRMLYTADSWNAWYMHIENQIANTKVGGIWKCTDPFEFLEETFFGRHDIIYEQYMFSDTEARYKMHRRNEEDGKRTNRKWMSRHVLGTITLGVPCLNLGNTVQWGCYDIDAHRSEEDTEADMIKKRLWAEQKTQMLLKYLNEHRLPYIYEESGSPYSYHIWISVVPVGARLAKWFFKSIALAAGVIGIEVNPKQERVGNKKSGNQVKLPWCKHRLYGTWSRMWINGRWTSFKDFEYIEHRAIKIDQVDPDAPELVRMKTVKEVLTDYVAEDGTEYACVETSEGYGMSGGIRPFFVWCLDKNLVGEEGHWMRIYVVREYLNAGYSHSEIAMLFNKQADFDFDISLAAVEGLATKDFGNVRYDSLWDHCESFAALYEEETGRTL